MTTPQKTISLSLDVLARRGYIEIATKSSTSGKAGGKSA